MGWSNFSRFAPKTLKSIQLLHFGTENTNEKGFGSESAQHSINFCFIVIFELINSACKRIQRAACRKPNCCDIAYMFYKIIKKGNSLSDIGKVSKNENSSTGFGSFFAYTNSCSQAGGE